MLTDWLAHTKSSLGYYYLFRISAMDIEGVKRRLAELGLYLCCAREFVTDDSFSFRSSACDKMQSMAVLRYDLLPQVPMKPPSRPFTSSDKIGLSYPHLEELKKCHRI